MVLTFDELRTANVERCEDVFHPLHRWSPTDWATAMAGECGESCNEVKKLRRLDDADASIDTAGERERLRLAIGKEIADMVIYADLLAARLDIDMGFAIAQKFNEVSRKRGSAVMLPPERSEAELIRSAQSVVRSVLSGERVGFNNALDWAAKWVESSATANGHPAVAEFAANMIMSFRANLRKSTGEHE